MARTTSKNNQAGAAPAPAPDPKGGDVKVDIEVEGEEKPDQVEKPEAVEAEVIEPDEVAKDAAEDDADDEAAERARVEAAIKAGEAAADEDFKSEADGLRAERQEARRRLG